MNDTYLVGTTTNGISFCLLWIVAVVLNVTSIGISCQATRVRPSWGNILVLSMALSDVCVLTFGLIPSLISLFLSDLLRQVQGLCHFQYVVLNTFVIANFLLVALVSFDQYLAVSHPFVYSVKIIRNPKRSLKIIGTALFLVAAGSAALPITTVASQADVQPVSPPIFCYYEFDSNKTQNIVLSSANVALMGLIGAAVTLSTFLIGLNLYKLYRSKPSGKHGHQSTNFAKLAAVIAIVYLSCTSPFVMVQVLNLSSVYVGQEVDYISICILLTSTLINPVVYILIRGTVKQSCKRLTEKLRSYRISAASSQVETNLKGKETNL